MKIAFVCTEKLPVPPVAGGAVQLYIDGILPYLSKQHEITVFGIKHPSLIDEELKNGIRYIRVPAASTENYVSGIRSRLNGGYGLVHVFNRPRWISKLCRDLPGTNFSLSLHNEMFHPEKITPAPANECIKRVEFINTVSSFIADGVKKLYPQAEEKLHVVYSGADIDLYRTNWSEQGLRNKMKLQELYNIKGKKVVLYVGRLSVKKGAHILLKAMKKVMEFHPDTALVIAGSKWYGKNETDDYVKSLKPLSDILPGPVIYTGFIPPSDIPKIYNLGDVFVCASQWNEPLARVHYEAMASGLPIISTSRGGNPEVVIPGENGFLIEDYANPDAFSDEIDFLLSNPKIASDMGHTGRKMAEEKYNWKRVASEVLKPLSEKHFQISTPAVKEEAGETGRKEQSFFPVDF